MASAATASMCNQEASIPKRYVKETVSTPPYDQDGPQYRGKTLPNLEKAERPTLVKLVQLREPLAHQGPLLLDHDPGVEDDDLLDLTPLRLRETRGELVELFYVDGSLSAIFSAASNCCYTSKSENPSVTPNST